LQTFNLIHQCQNALQRHNEGDQNFVLNFMSTVRLRLAVRLPVKPGCWEQMSSMFWQI